jgi:hypothetical protein
MARQTLMGWRDDLVWQDAMALSEAHETVLLDAIVRSATEDPGNSEPSSDLGGS